MTIPNQQKQIYEAPMLRCKSKHEILHTAQSPQSSLHRSTCDVAVECAHGESVPADLGNAAGETNPPGRSKVLRAIHVASVRSGRSD